MGTVTVEIIENIHWGILVTGIHIGHIFFDRCATPSNRAYRTNQITTRSKNKMEMSVTCLGNVMSLTRKWQPVLYPNNVWLLVTR